MPFLGLGFYWAWVALVFYSNALVPGSVAAMTGPPAIGANQPVESIWLWATCSHMVGLLACVALQRRIPDMLANGLLRIAGAGGISLATALVPVELALLGPQNPACQPMVLATTVFMGLTSAWMVLQWAEVYGRLRSSSVAVASTLSFALGLALYFVVFAFPPVITTVMAVLFPLCSWVALGECLRREADAGRSGWPESGEGCGRKGAAGAVGSGGSASPSFGAGQGLSVLGRMVLPVASVFVFALCGEMLRAFSLSLAGASVDGMGALYLLGGLIGLAALSAYVLVPKRSAKAGAARTRQFTIPLLRGVLLFMAVAFLAAPFLAGSSLAAAYGIFGAGFWCFRAITWAVCFPLARQQGIRPLCAVGVLDATYAISVVIGSSLNAWLTEALKVGTTELTTVSLIAVFALMFMALFVVNESDLGTVLGSAAGRGATAAPDVEGEAVPGEAAGAADAPEGDPVAATVTHLAAACGLTPREAEVAVLLAKGRSLPFVQEELYISAGTAQTHARHIYKKLGVHSRQELIDLVERSAGR